MSESTDPQTRAIPTPEEMPWSISYLHDSIDETKRDLGNRIDETNHSLRDDIKEAKRDLGNRIDETNRLLHDGLKETNRRIDETNRLLHDSIDETNRSLHADIKETNRRIDETNRSLHDGLKETNNRIDENQPRLRRANPRRSQAHGHLFPVDHGHVGDHHRRPHRRHQALSTPRLLPASFTPRKSHCRPCR